MKQDKLRVYEVPWTIADSGSSIAVTLPNMVGNLLLVRAETPSLTTSADITFYLRAYPNDEVAADADRYVTIASTFTSNSTVFADPADATEWAAGETVPIFNYNADGPVGEIKTDMQITTADAQTGAKSGTIWLYLEEF